MKRTTYFVAMLLLNLGVLASVMLAAEPDLVMSPTKVTTFKARAKAKVVTERLRGASVADDGERRQPPSTDIVTPGPDCGSTQQSKDTAARWCRAMGYEWLCGRGDFVDRWYARIAAGSSIDPATMAAEEGFDSPSINCDYDYSMLHPGFEDMHVDPDAKMFPVLEITRNGLVFEFDTDEVCGYVPGVKARGSCRATVRTACVNEKWPTTFRFKATRTKCLNQSTGQLTNGPCP